MCPTLKGDKDAKLVCASWGGVFLRTIVRDLLHEFQTFATGSNRGGLANMAPVTAESVAHTKETIIGDES